MKANLMNLKQIRSKRQDMYQTKIRSDLFKIIEKAQQKSDTLQKQSKFHMSQSIGASLMFTSEIQDLKKNSGRVLPTSFREEK